MPLDIFRLVLLWRQYRGGLDMTPGLDVSLSVRGGRSRSGSDQVRSDREWHRHRQQHRHRHSYLVFCFVLGPGRLVRPLPGFGWGRLSAPPSVAGLGSPWAPPSLCLLVVGAPVGVPSVGGLLPSSFPPSGVPPWGCGVRTSTSRQAKPLRFCLC